MGRLQKLLTISALTALTTQAARITPTEAGHRIDWLASSELVYQLETSPDLSEWSALGPVIVGDDTERSYTAPLGDADLAFYRLLRIPADNFKSSATDGATPDYLAWVTELSDGSLKFNFYARIPSDFADVHYSVNGGSQLNLRMDGSGPRFTYVTPPLAVDDDVDFYFTFDREGPVEDTPNYAHIVGGDNDGGAGNGGGDGGSGGADYEDVLPEPAMPSGYTHGISVTGNNVEIRLKPGVTPDNVIVAYQLNEGSEQSHFMTPDGDEWSYSLSAADGDALSYSFYSIDPNHIRSPTFTRTIGTAQPDAVEPLEILAAGRFRDRHENELRFDPYVENYFDRSYFGLRILDYGDSVDVEFAPAEPMNFVDIKLFDQLETPHEERGIDVRADYGEGHRMIPAGDNFYWRIDDVEDGQFIDTEFTLQRTRTGQQYYTAIFRFFVGDGALTQRIQDDEAYSGGATSVDVYSETDFSFAQAAHNARPNTLRDFLDGKNVFDREYDEATGLGPLYNANSCVQCHVNDGSARPPQSFEAMMNGMLVRLAERDSDGAPHGDYGIQLQDRAVNGTFPEGRGHVTYTETPGQFGDGGAYSLARPNYTFSGLQGPGFLSAVTSPRVAPKLIGMGLLEAIPQSTLEAWEDPNDDDGDGISGRINWVTDPVSGQPAPGRFGWKATEPTVEAQTAIALREDIGVANPVYPGDGAEISETDFDALAHYTKLLGVPLRRDYDDPEVIAGEQLFHSMQCVSCHIPEVTTGNGGDLTELHAQRIRPYTDLLVHDMGDGLADELQEGDASGREWRTAPLWGIGRTGEVSGHSRYLHDGRARNLTEAILWHGGEAEASKEAFRQLSEEDRARVIAFLRSL